MPRFDGRLGEALRRVALERPDRIFHCGDLTTIDVVTALERIAPVDAVAGNNDGPDIVARFGRRKIVEVDGVRFGLIHGDGTRGTTLSRARNAFEGDAPGVIAFGHSHVPYAEMHAGTWLVNPGSPTDKRRQDRFSFAIVGRDETGAVAPRLVFFP